MRHVSAVVGGGRQHRDLARLVRLFAEGERLAHAVASRQAATATLPAMARFFAAQARQERLHAWIFDAAAERLCPGAVSAPTAPLATVGAALHRDLDRGHLWRSVVGLQVALETLGETLLDELGALVLQHAPVLMPIHRLLALQETAHRTFGVRRIEAALAAQEMTRVSLRAASVEYGALTRNVLGACAEILDGLNAPTAQYAQRFDAALPGWFVAAEAA